jgi:1-acyl-sn-glycerol-3-phosphate acyltransferase
MKWVNRAFRVLWSIWCIVPFLSVSLLLVPFVFFLTLFKGGRKPSLWLCLYIGSPLMLWSMGLFPKIRNRRFIKKNTGYVVVSNHSAQFDILVNPYAFRSHPNVFTFLSKKEIGNIPIFGILARRVGVLVDRKSQESRKRSYRYMKKVLEEGISIMIYPEGTRNKGEVPLQPFYDGAFKLAIEMQTPILVQTIVGMKKRMDNRYIFDACPGRVECIWDEPIPTEGLTYADVPALKEKVRSIMLRHLIKEEN